MLQVKKLFQLPKDLNSLPDIRRWVAAQMTPEKVARIADKINKKFDLPVLNEAQEKALFVEVVTLTLKLASGE